MDRYRPARPAPLRSADLLASLDPQPDPNTDYEAWARYVSTNYYVLKHLFGSILGVIFAIFGTVALGAYLSRSRAGRLGLVAMISLFWVTPYSLRSAGFLPSLRPVRVRRTWRA